MKTISMQKFTIFMSQALPEIMAALMREDRGAVSTGKLTLPQFWALYHIDQKEELTVNDLAKKMHRSKSTISVLLHRLVERKLVKRKQNKVDRRVVYFSLTAPGKKTIEALEKTRQEGIQRIYSVFTPEQRADYKTLVQKVIKSAGTTSIFLFFFWGTHVAFGATTNAYTLKQSIKIGLQRSVLVANAKREKAIAKAKKSESFSDALPQIRGVADYFLYDDDNLTKSGSTRAGAEASWQIYAGGRTASALRAAKIYQQLTADQERRIKAEQVRDIAFAYHRVQLATAQVDVLKRSVEQLENFESETEKKYKAGTASEFDWLSAKVSLANEKPNLIAAKNRLNLTQASFSKLTFIKDKNFTLSDPLKFVPLRVRLDEMIEKGLQTRPELLEKGAAIRLRKEGIQQEKSAYYPNVNLIGTYNYYEPDPYAFMSGAGGEGWQNHWSAGIRMTWSLFDGGRRKARVGIRTIEVAIEEDQYIDLRRSITLEIQTYWLRGRDSAEVIRATAENVTLAKRALEISRARFDAGLGRNLEVTQANVELSKAKLARLTALYEYMNAVVGLKYATGTLLKEFENE